MRYLILIISLMGGFVSFNSYAANCPAGIKIPSGTYSPVINGVLGSNIPFSINIHGCEYAPVDINYIVYTEGPLKGSIFSSNGFISTGNVIKTDDDPNTGDSDTGDSDDSDTPPTDPDKPVEPQLPDYSKPAYPQDMVFVNNQLAYINSHTPDQLYKNYHLVYDYNRTWADNRAVYQALVNKLHDVYPPTYQSAEMFNAADKAWQNAYWQSVPRLQGVPDKCKIGFLLPEECEVYKPLMDAYSKYVSPGVSTITGAIGNINGVNDPDYYSYSDYKNGITRCDINPTDTSCNNPDDSGGGDGNNPDDGNTDNSGTGGGSGSGSTDSNDNGDVVAAIERFHADNNKNHKELMDDLNKKPAPPDYTGMEGEFSSMVGGAMSGVTDSVKSAWDAGKAAFGEGLSGIDSILPDIKTSFDLPPGFEAASSGRCIPVVLDFDIKLVGIPDYHFHAEGTQVCLLYDKYVRPVLNFVLVILSFFVIHRLLVRSAEFLTDGRR
ncbi:hypothetical protein GAT78_00055 [Salmonella enterica]|nr:hypothetical protein [Salmonella enterica]